MQSVGKYTYGTEGIKIFHFGDNNIGKIIIGSYCSIAPNVSMFLNENHRYDWVTTYPFGHLHKNTFNNYNKDQKFLYSMSKGNGDIIIGNDVWLGMNVTIMSGVTIGDGAVIAANSHIIKNVEPYSIIGGNPAKFIKYRFSKEQIYELLKIKWWNFNENIINDNLNLLLTNNIDEFINKFKV
jgi:acetyltransferase-like isoleucine patch superfamily enzyme